MPSVILQELLTELGNARDGTTLVLGQATLGQTSAAGLLDLFTNDLQITSFTLEDVQLPASVTGDELVISGHDPTLALDLTFTEGNGEVAIDAVFSAPAIATLQQSFPALPSDLFSPIVVSGATASVTVPGLAGPVTFTTPRYGVTGLVLPSSGLVTTSVSGRVDGPTSGSPDLYIEVQPDVKGYNLAPLTSTWSFADLGRLLPAGLDLLTGFPAIIPTGGLGLSRFGLFLYGDAPEMSSISLAVADTADPAKPLWSALDGKIALTDVIVTLNLTYSDTGALVLAGEGSVQGDFLLNGVAVSVGIPFPPTGIWSLTAYPNLQLPGLADLGYLLGYNEQQFAALLPAKMGDIGGFTFSYLRVAVDVGNFSLKEFTFAIDSSNPWILIPGVLELKSLQIRLSIDGTPSVTGMVLGAFGLPGGSDIMVSFGRSTPQDSWRLDVVSAAIALPSLGQLAQLAQGENLGALVTAGGLDSLRFVMTDLNIGLTIDPAELTNLGLTLQLANATDPQIPVLDWPIIPGVLTLTKFAFGFQLRWGTAPSTTAFGVFVMNGLEFAIRFAAKSGGTDGLLAQYTAIGPGAGTINVKDLINSVAPGVADGLPAGLTITLEDAALAYLGADAGPAKFLFAMDISAGSAVAGLDLGPKTTSAIASLSLLVVSDQLTAQDVTFINGMSATPLLPASPDGIPAGFAFTAEITNLNIGDFLADLDSQYGIGQIPEPIRTLTLNKVSISYSSGTGSFAFDLEAGFEVETAPVAVSITITVMPAKQVPAQSQNDPYTTVTQGTQGYAATFTGQVKFAGIQFDLVFSASDVDVLVADVVRTGGPIVLQSLVETVSDTLAQQIPPGITINPEEVKFVFLKQATSQWAFGVRLGLAINLNELPAVGSKLPSDLTLAIENLQVLYSSAALVAAQTALINALLPSGVTKLPVALDPGIAFGADVQLGGETKHIEAGVTPPPPATTGAVVPASSTDPVKWLDINKQFGIFSFERVGVGYQDNVLLFALDASVALGPLAFSMQALSIGSPLSTFDPQFSLQGLALTFDRPPITIGGAFLKVKETIGDQTFDAYYGQLIVQVASYGLKALGGWAPDANPASFFIYLSINAPLGGPPFLFLTGLAGGFGINSQLTLPTIDEVSTYPLLPAVAMPEQATPAETIKAVIPFLQKRFTPMAGQYWVAAGIAFTSFEMIEAQAVISVSFGVELQIGVVGTCSMTFPTGDPDPVAYVEIDVVASFTPSTGLLAVDGKLSPASYLFGGFVKLSGGFAFYAWFSGEHQGDFVVSLGGYHPAFVKPANYPAVPRLALEFSLGPLKVIGQSYFALTPSAFMAGLRLTATFEAGPVKAWFDAGVDFLIAWAPFHYDAHAWVTIGCSVDLGLFTISVQIGADLHIWGPAFGGEATVDLDVVSFTIAFGASQAPPDPVGWTTFASNFLPPPDAAPAAPAIAARAAFAPRAAAAPAAADPVPNIVKASVTAGMIGQADGLDWILDPDNFRIVTSSTIPANYPQWAVSAADTADLPTAPASYHAGDPPAIAAEAVVAPPPQMRLQLDYGTVTSSDTAVWAPVLNIAPMGEQAVRSYHVVTLLKSDQAGQYTQYVTGVTVAPQLTASNTALWGAQSADLNDPRLIPATLTGLAISPVPRTPDQISDVPLLALIYGQGNTTGFGYQSPVVDQQYTVTSAVSADQETFTITVGGAPIDPLTNTGYVLKALADPWVATQRTATLDELVRLGFSTKPGADVNVDKMAAAALTDWPSAARIGTEVWA
jgi:hypothetical protein